MVDVPAHMLLG